MPFCQCGDSRGWACSGLHVSHPRGVIRSSGAIGRVAICSFQFWEQTQLCSKALICQGIQRPFGGVILWIYKILHHFQLMENHCLLVFIYRGIVSLHRFLGGVGFRLSTVLWREPVFRDPVYPRRFLQHGAYLRRTIVGSWCVLSLGLAFCYSRSCSIRPTSWTSSHPWRLTMRLTSKDCSVLKSLLGVPSYQLAWKCADPFRKTRFLHFHVCWWGGYLLAASCSANRPQLNAGVFNLQACSSDATTQ